MKDLLDRYFDDLSALHSCDGITLENDRATVPANSASIPWTLHKISPNHRPHHRVVGMIPRVPPLPAKKAELCRWSSDSPTLDILTLKDSVRFSSPRRSISNSQEEEKKDVPLSTQPSEVVKIKAVDAPVRPTRQSSFDDDSQFITDFASLRRMEGIGRQRGTLLESSSSRPKWRVGMRV
mmetsp:Transcript_19009/g.39360  ORF Transcript_19009/g.39360 Transcript_19009/m.39360 type:complete len:180 (-) Transcript_19009:63-602(-)|eukprot:CAMPEP_0172458110 /NCGR_PEP_ID=MMETSP1065-20121228/25824_1 /TAXON_ID=265537 /ORGANISM="Amphiprora paludosa, Strain CCMP125" /LENGTH=179 /DNA_ID=CAMNT_0013212193 /DNA_START=235 /DNA_END=774 /DNA_ORIENTATION=+